MEQNFGTLQKERIKSGKLINSDRNRIYSASTQSFFRIYTNKSKFAMLESQYKNNET